jgi:hypothetical protein
MVNFLSMGTSMDIIWYPRIAFSWVWMSAFRDRGAPGPTSECRRVPQPRWVEREGEREGGRARRPETGVVPTRPTLSKRALVLPFIGIRRGSRCTMGGVAECYVSSRGELAP